MIIGLKCLTKVGIHLELLYVALGVIVLIMIIRISVFVIRRKKVEKYIQMQDFEKALEMLIRIEKSLPRGGLLEESFRIWSAVIYLYQGDKLRCFEYLASISNQQLQLARNYWYIVIALSERKWDLVEQYTTAFDHCIDPKSITLSHRAEYEKQLWVIKEYCKNPDERAKRALEMEIQTCKGLEGTQRLVLGKLFLQDQTKFEGVCKNSDVYSQSEKPGDINE